MAEAEGLGAKISMVVSALGAHERAILAQRLTPAVFVDVDNPMIAGIYESTLQAMEQAGEIMPGAKSLKQSVFEVLKDFIIPIAPAKKMPARIASASIDAIWKWYARNIAAELALKTALGLLAAQMKRDEAKCIMLVKDFRAQFVQDAQAAIRASKVDELTASRFRAQVGGEQAVHDLHDVVNLLDNLETVQGIRTQILEYNFANNAVVEDSFVAKMRKFISGETNDFAFMAAVCAQLMMIYDGNQQNLVRYMFAPKTDLVPTSQLLNNPFLPCLEWLASELDLHVVTLKQLVREQANAAIIVSAVKKYYLAAKMLSVEIEFAPSDAIGKHFIHIRKEITEILKGELNDLMPMINRSIRQMRPRSGDGVQIPDDETLARIEYMLAIYDGIRHMGAEIALNDFLAQMKSNLEKLLDHTITVMLGEPIATGEEALANYTAVSEVLVRFAVSILGAEVTQATKKNFQAIINNRISQSAAMAS